MDITAIFANQEKIAGTAQLMVQLKQLKDNEIAFNDELDKYFQDLDKSIPRFKSRRMALLQKRQFLKLLLIQLLDWLFLSFFLKAIGL